MVLRSKALVSDCAFALTENKVPTTFSQAWYHSDSAEQTKWRTAIHGELRQMLDKEVWTELPEESVPKARTKIGTKWVFAIKNDGRYRARLVALGFMQREGQDYTTLYSPLISDLAIRILIIFHLQTGLHMHLIDVKAAFLESDYEETLFLRLPKGLKETKLKKL